MEITSRSWLAGASPDGGGDKQMTTSLDTLADLIRAHGPIGCVRVSSAKSQVVRYFGAVNYWGAVRYELRLAQAGHVTYAAIERASSDRRSERLALADAYDLAARTGRLVHLGYPGRVSETRATEILCELAEMARAAQELAA